jgi:predicted Zn-ribbon and HTH transcriptional regulator
MTNQAETKEIVTANRAMEVAEIESQIATAKRYPRDIKIFKERLMSMANLDQETAEGCYYALPRSGKAIDGPSVRLAEIALACYQNCVAEADVLMEDERFIYAMGQCRDLENNIAVRIKVRRRITTKEGKRYNDDMIAVTANAACAIALRNAIFKVIPGAYIKPVFNKVKQTAVGEAQSLANRRAEVIARLTKFGVTEDRILRVLNRRSIEEVTFDDVAILIGLSTAIKDGDTTVEGAFPDTFKEAQTRAAENNKAKAGSESVDVNMEDKKEKQAKKTTKKAAKKSAKKKNEETTYLYHCNNCGLDFNEPRISGSGATTVAICPSTKCLSKNIVANEDAPHDQKPDFMKD